MSRAALVGNNQDPRRNIDDECGYPTDISPEDYRALYDREPIASRVVQVMPLECWQVTPDIYEDEDVENITPFEQAWTELGKTLRGGSLFQDAEGNPIFEYLMRADVLSGIGSFGVILLGIDDGKELQEPVDGFTDSLNVGMSIPSQYGTQAQYGAITLRPTPEKPKLPYTVNVEGEVIDADGQLVGNMVFNDSPTRPWVRRPEDDEQAQGPAGPAQVFNPRAFYDQPRNEFQNEPSREYTDDQEDDDADQNFASTPNDDQDQYQGVGDDEGMESGPPGDMAAEEGDMEDVDGEFGEDDEEQQGPVETKRKLLYIRCFDETLVKIVQYESDPTNPRFGQPVMYNITLNDPKFMHGGSGLSFNVVKVHWSRVIHVADNLGTSEIFGVPRMQPVYNRLLDLKKLHSGSAEMYWKGAFPGFNLMTHPQLGGDVTFDADDIKDQMEQYMNGLQRYTAFIGMSMNSLAPQVVDPTTQIQVQLEAVCVRLAVPMRVFMGSERGELASSQDSGTWNGRLKQRHNGYLTPRLLVPFIDRLIAMGVLPTPQGYSVVWPDLESLSDLEKAQKAATLTQALAGYVSGGIEQIMTLRDYLVRVFSWDEKEAEQVEENSRMNQQINDQQMMTLDPEADQELHDAQVEQMTNPDLVPDNIQTGDQHHYEAGSMDRKAELEHERLMDQQQQGADNGAIDEDEEESGIPSQTEKTGKTKQLPNMRRPTPGGKR